jgi:hypothetical protein
MPSPLHNTLAGGIGHEISIQLGVFRNSPEPKTAELGRSISPTDDVDIEFHVAAKRFDRRNPDKTYTYTGCNFPGLVIEVAWSQRQLDLAGLAEEYIQRSEGSIRTVVGVNVEYRVEAPATFSVWHAQVDKSNGEEILKVIETVENRVKYPLIASDITVP